MNLLHTAMTVARNALPEAPLAETARALASVRGQYPHEMITTMFGTMERWRFVIMEVYLMESMTQHFFGARG